MCKVMEDMRNETAKRTEEQTTLMHIRSIMDSLGMTVEKAMETLKIPQSDREEYVLALRNPHKADKKRRFLQSAGKIGIDAAAVSDLKERSFI